jgi:hypothetical protein
MNPNANRYDNGPSAVDDDNPDSYACHGAGSPASRRAADLMGKLMKAHPQQDMKIFP